MEFIQNGETYREFQKRVGVENINWIIDENDDYVLPKYKDLDESTVENIKAFIKENYKKPGFDTFFDKISNPQNYIKPDDRTKYHHGLPFIKQEGEFIVYVTDAYDNPYYDVVDYVFNIIVVYNLNNGKYGYMEHMIPDIYKQQQYKLGQDKIKDEMYERKRRDEEAKLVKYKQQQLRIKQQQEEYAKKRKEIDDSLFNAPPGADKFLDEQWKKINEVRISKKGGKRTKKRNKRRRRTRKHLFRKL
jgi:hypothetical protein